MTACLFVLSLDLHSLITMTTQAMEPALRSMPYQTGVWGTASAHCLILGKQNVFNPRSVLQPWSTAESKYFHL